MRKQIIMAFLILLISNVCYSGDSSIIINDKGKIQDIRFNKISLPNGINILALIVADDLIRLAKKWDSDGKYMESISLLTAVNYLDITNKESLEYATKLRQKLINNEISKAKLFKDYINEAKAGIKDTNNIHQLQIQMALIIIQEAKNMYPSTTKQHREAVDLEDRIKVKTMNPDELEQIAIKLSSEAEKEYHNGNIAKAINKYSMAYYARKDVNPIIKIAGIIQEQL